MPILHTNGLHFTLIGDFNPAIFHPAWFSAEKLITETEAKEAADVLCAPQYAKFQLPWATFSITQDHFNVSTTRESHFEPLRDLVVGTFKLLKHTPIKKLGINVEQHYQYEDFEKWNSFGHKLAPKEIWKNFMDDPGLLSLTMTDKTVRKDPPGLTRVDVQSSLRVKPGIYFGINNHYDCDSNIPVGASYAVKIIESEFAKALENSKKIIQILIYKQEITRANQMVYLLLIPLSLFLKPAIPCQMSISI